MSRVSARIPTLKFLPNRLRSDLHRLYHDLFSNYAVARTEDDCSTAVIRVLAVSKLVLPRNGRNENQNRNFS